MKENKMGIMPVNRLLVTMSLPIMASMLISALYNIIDSMFVAQINEDALTAVSLAFPLQNLMIAVAVGTGVGINSLMAKSLGQKDKEKASSIAEHGLVLAVFSFIAFLIFGIFGSKLYFEIQKTSQTVVAYGTQYLSVCLIFSIGLFIQIAFERILQATGRTFFTMITQGVGAIVNIILDPIMIFGLFGFPQLGVAGAAIATVCGQILAGILSIYLNHRYNHDICINVKSFRFNFQIIKEIYKIGIPSIIMSSISSVMTFGINQILLVFNQTTAAFFGIYIKLQSFIFMPIFGLNNGMVPIISYNFGAQKKERITKTIRLGIFYATFIMLIGLLIFQFFPIPLLNIFNASDHLIQIGVPGLRIISLHFIFAGASIILSTALQALGHAFYSLIISVARQLVVLLPVAYLMSLSGIVDYVWFAYPIAEIVSLILGIFFFIKVYQEKIVPLPSIYE